MQVSEAYVAVLRMEGALQVAQSHADSLTAHNEDVKNLYDQGVVPKNDLLAANVELANAQQLVVQAIAEHYFARLCIFLIGERPGLSSPDSMGIYYTYLDRSGISTDADRNCISNVHKNGLGYEQALKKLLFLINESEKLQLSGG